MHDPKPAARKALADALYPGRMTVLLGWLHYVLILYQLMLTLILI